MNIILDLHDVYVVKSLTNHKSSLALTTAITIVQPEIVMHIPSLIVVCVALKGCLLLHEIS